jgi:hypothetical protein
MSAKFNHSEKDITEATSRIELTVKPKQMFWFILRTKTDRGNPSRVDVYVINDDEAARITKEAAIVSGNPYSVKSGTMRFNEGNSNRAAEWVLYSIAKVKGVDVDNFDYEWL